MTGPLAPPLQDLAESVTVAAQLLCLLIASLLCTSVLMVGLCRFARLVVIRHEWRPYSQWGWVQRRQARLFAAAVTAGDLEAAEVPLTRLLRANDAQQGSAQPRRCAWDESVFPTVLLVRRSTLVGPRRGGTPFRHAAPSRSRRVDRSPSRPPRPTADDPRGDRSRSGPDLPRRHGAIRPRGPHDATPRPRRRTPFPTRWGGGDRPCRVHALAAVETSAPRHQSHDQGWAPTLGPGGPRDLEPTARPREPPPRMTSHHLPGESPTLDRHRQRESPRLEQRERLVAPLEPSGRSAVRHRARPADR